MADKKAAPRVKSMPAGGRRKSGGVAALHPPTPRHYPVRIRDNANFRNPVHYKQTMPMKIGAKLSDGTAILKDHPTLYKPTNMSDERGNNRGFNESLMPETDNHWPWNTNVKDINENDPRIKNRPDLYKEEVISDTLLDKYNSFGEYKNSRTYDDFYPKLFKVPERVYPGRLFSTGYGSFDWWKSEPNFDWWRSGGVYVTFLLQLW